MATYCSIVFLFCFRFSIFSKLSQHRNHLVMWWCISITIIRLSHLLLYSSYPKDNVTTVLLLTPVSIRYSVNVYCNDSIDLFLYCNIHTDSVKYSI